MKITIPYRGTVEVEVPDGTSYDTHIKDLYQAFYDARPGTGDNVPDVFAAWVETPDGQRNYGYRRDLE